MSANGQINGCQKGVADYFKMTLENVNFFANDQSKDFIPVALIVDKMFICLL